MRSTPARVPAIVRSAWSVYRRVAYVRELLRSPITLTEARTSIQSRMAERAPAFLDMVERTIFAQPDSAYRSLLDGAGYDLPAIKALVGAAGVEGALHRLAQDGVYISIEEFKGNRPTRRGPRTYRFDPEAFNNPLFPRGLQVLSGGTRSGRLPTTISWANHRMGVDHLAVALSAYGLLSCPVVVWLAQAHGASLWAVLALANMGKAPQRWFTQLAGRLGGLDSMHGNYPIMRAAARASGVALPPLTHVAVGQEERILRWIASRAARNGCGIVTTPSLALRLALAAGRHGASLAGVVFVTIAEPLTPAKLATIRAQGGQAFSSLGFTEFGRATYGCAAPEAADDTHLCRDAVAVIQRHRIVDNAGSAVNGLLFTALRPDARKILLNMETGDYATLSTRRCGCPLEGIGWTEHLHGIRSFEKLNAEGRLFFGSDLISLVEEILPAQFGGDPTDYQLVESEDKQGFTRLTVLVDPRLGHVDERGIIERVETGLQLKHAVNSRVWRETGTIRLARAKPIFTKAGKLMPLHHLGVNGDLVLRTAPHAAHSDAPGEPWRSDPA